MLARGRIDVYEARGEYQLLVEVLEPQGLGALQLAFEQLKKKLAAEGLFAPERKRPLPRFPRRIGIVTSPRGAAIADMVQILSRRFPGLHIRLFPALVQGEGSVEEVCRGIEYFSRTGGPTWSSWAAAAARSKISGPSTKRPWRAPSPPAPCRWSRRWATRPTSPSPISSPTCARPRLRPPPKWWSAPARSCSTGSPAAARKAAQAHALPPGDAGAPPAPAGHRARAQPAASPHRAAACSASTSRNTACASACALAIDSRERARRALEDAPAPLRYAPAPGRRPPPPGGAPTRSPSRSMRLRLARRRSRLEQLAAKLSQLSPLRILERGYAIVSNQSGNPEGRRRRAAGIAASTCGWPRVGWTRWWRRRLPGRTGEVPAINYRCESRA